MEQEVRRRRIASLKDFVKSECLHPIGTLFSISPSLSLFLPRARICLFHHGDWTSQDQWGTSPAGRPPTVEFVDVGIVSKVLYCVFQYNPLHAPAYPWHNPRPSRATGCNYHCSTSWHREEDHYCCSSPWYGKGYCCYSTPCHGKGYCCFTQSRK